MNKSRSTAEKKFPATDLVEKFDVVNPLVRSLMTEMREIARKKPDGVLNPVKVKIANRLLQEIKTILADEASTIYLDLLDEETLPQNADAVIILGQYCAAMDSFREKYHGNDGISRRWFTKDNPRTKY